jgi:L-alanine-DL-glutamate epimerase-like enolase superfamily enzyme
VSATVAAQAGPSLGRLAATAYTIPTDRPESDGTLSWDSTTIVVAEASAGGEKGIGWTYAPAAAARLIDDVLVPTLEEMSCFDIGAGHLAMRVALRNAGVPGLGSMAISAVDVALWDLKAKLLGVAVASLLGRVHEQVPIYGSGGFCSYTPGELRDQLAGWVDQGITRVKMKGGRDPDADLERVRQARAAIGDAELFIDANGAFTAKEALRFAEQVAPLGVTWFEEPVSSLDRDGLRLVRARCPAGMDVAAGEYASTAADFLALTGVVDCLQADVTRCGAIAGLLLGAVIAGSHELELSGHTSPMIHAHALCAVPKLRHLEWFHDHVRIERLLFEGFLEPVEGAVRPDLSRPGLGVELRRADAEPYAA